jgi:uncharacterized protein DUF4194
MTHEFFDTHINANTNNGDALVPETDASVISDPLEAIDPEIALESEAEEGTLPDEVRKALVMLLKKGSLLAAKKPQDFDAICQYQATIRPFLANIFLNMTIDEAAGLIFVKEPETAENEELEVTLLNKRTLSLYDTLVLVVLRKHYQERQATGEQKVTISIESVEENLTPFLTLTNSSTADRKKVTGALNKMVDKQVISTISGSDDRFEITPIIRHVASAEVLEQLLVDYLKLAKEAGVSDEVIKRVDTLDEQEKQEQIELTMPEQANQFQGAN